jgi:hypothetical protein
MSTSGESEFSREEIESLAEKVQTFAASLPEREQTAFAHVLRKAAIGTDPTGRESSYGSPVEAHIARAVQGRGADRSVYDEIFEHDYEPSPRLKIA